MPYFYGYFKVVDSVGEKAIFSVPTGAFGNLFGGCLARAMGLPVEVFVCANNANAAAKNLCQRIRICNLNQLCGSLRDAMALYAQERSN